MIGTIVNVGAILTGSVIGSFVSRGIDERYKTALFDGLGLATLGLGVNAFVSNLPKTTYPVLFIASIAIGTVIGTRLDIADASIGCSPARRAAASWRRACRRRFCCSASERCLFLGRLKAGSTAITRICLRTRRLILCRRLFWAAPMAWVLLWRRWCCCYGRAAFIYSLVLSRLT